MSNSPWDTDTRPSPQASPRGSYRPQSADDGDYRGSGGKGDAYDSDGPHVNAYGSPGQTNAGRYDSPRGSEHNFEHDGSGYGSNQGSARHYSSHGSEKGHSSPHGSLKDFASDHGSVRKYNGSDHGSAKNGSEYGHQYGSNGGHYEGERESGGGAPVKDTWRPGMTWIDRRTFYMGEACAAPPDWQNHPILRQVQMSNHQQYRQNRLEEWLTSAHRRHPGENFGAYMWRASVLANSELKQRKKQCFGDEYTNPVDKFVMRLFYGMKLKLERSESIILRVDEETYVLEILREECEDLYKSGQLYPDQRNIQYTPLLAPDINNLSDRSYMGY